MPKTISYGERFIFVLTCEWNAKGKVFTFCDLVSYCESKTVQTKVFSCLLLFSTIPFDHGAYGVRDFNCRLNMRQKCINSPLICSVPLSVTKILGIPNLNIQRLNKALYAFAASFLGEG